MNVQLIFLPHSPCFILDHEGLLFGKKRWSVTEAGRALLVGVRRVCPCSRAVPHTAAAQRERRLVTCPEDTSLMPDFPTPFRLQGSRRAEQRTGRDRPPCALPTAPSGSICSPRFADAGT